MSALLKVTKVLGRAMIALTYHTERVTGSFQINGRASEIAARRNESRHLIEVLGGLEKKEGKPAMLVGGLHHCDGESERGWVAFGSQQNVDAISTRMPVIATMYSYLIDD